MKEIEEIITKRANATLAKMVDELMSSTSAFLKAGSWQPSPEYMQIVEEKNILARRLVKFAEPYVLAEERKKFVALMEAIIDGGVS